MKPKQNYYISEAEKQRIIDEIIKPKSIIAVQSQIIDPEYLYLILDINAEYDPKKTTLTELALKQNIRNAVLAYRNANLNKFGARIADSKLETAIDNVDLNAINGNEISIRAQKRFQPTLNTTRSYEVKFNIPLHRGTISNKLTSTEFDVLDVTGVRRTVTLDELPQSYTGVTSISVTNPGTGYTTTPTVTITGDGTGKWKDSIDYCNKSWYQLYSSNSNDFRWQWLRRCSFSNN